MEAKMVKLTIDGIDVEVEEGTSILDAAKKVGRNIPTLCYHEDLPATAGCGICVVDINGRHVRSCCTPVSPNQKIVTNTKELRKERKMILELILSNHNVDCPTCSANNACELQVLSNMMGVDMENLPLLLEKQPLDETSVSIVRDPNKCILCNRCVEVCDKIQTVNALTVAGRGFNSFIDTAFNKGMANSPCVNCGQCIIYCPTGALSEKSHVESVWQAILDPEKHVIVQEAPSIRASIGEEFGMEIGTVSTGKMYAALKTLGFDAIFDTNFSADLTIMEEGTEVISRVVSGGKLPVITSCSPGWVKFMETFFPDLAHHVSTAKSPQQMMGVIAKTYYAEEKKIDPSKIVSVSIMPCTAKKFEAQRPEMRDSGYQDVDYVLTTREFVKMMKEAGVDLKTVKEDTVDPMLAEYTGAATIFGATGGVMEAALRTVYAVLSGKEMGNVEITPVRGMKGIKEMSVTVPLKDGGELPVKVAVAHGLGNARQLLEKVREQLATTGKSEYTFIEIMACPGGCVGGGGQPRNSTFAKRARRGLGLYQEDHDLPQNKRCSHQNEAVKRIYAKFLGSAGSEKAHHLLHTNYVKRSTIDGQSMGEVTHKH